MSGKKHPAVGIAVIPRKVRRSAAWRAVSDNARKVLVAMAARYDGRNNGQLAFSGDDGLLLGLSAIDTQLALIELERVGLIASQLQGGRQ